MVSTHFCYRQWCSSYRQSLY